MEQSGAAALPPSAPGAFVFFSSSPLCLKCEIWGSSGRVRCLHLAPAAAFTPRWASSSSAHCVIRSIKEKTNICPVTPRSCVSFRFLCFSWSHAAKHKFSQCFSDYSVWRACRDLLGSLLQVLPKRSVIILLSECVTNTKRVWKESKGVYKGCVLGVCVESRFEPAVFV